MSAIVISGGGRGVGLELVRQLGELPTSQVSTIITTTRGPPSQQLRDLISASLGRILHVQCEITTEIGVQKAAAEIKSKLTSRGLDILINNVGTMPVTQAGVGAMKEELSTAFDVNVVSTHRFTAALIPLMRKSVEKKIIMISTPLGSIAYANRYTWNLTPAYKITKAALNMLSVQYAIEYGKEGFTVLAAAPGWLRTDMGSQDADLDVSTGVCALIDLIFLAGTDRNGKFFNIHVTGWEHADGPNQYDGAEIPW